MNRLRFVCAIGFAMLLSFCYGICVHKYQLPPYTWLRAIKEAATQQDDDSKSPTLPSADQMRALITIDSAKAVSEKRDQLVQYIWGESGLPRAVMPAHVFEGVEDEAFAGLRSLTRIDRLEIDMDYGLRSVAYHFHPATGDADCVVIYYQRHRGHFKRGRNTIQTFLENGCSVIALSMPLLGMNNQPTVEVPGVGPLALTTHDRLKFLDRPIRFFVEPVIAVLNYADQHFGYKLVAMIGISGGGWTTTLSAAIDPRIACSYPVAGSYPICLRSTGKEWGDFEQTLPSLYSVANYLDLYVLGATGPGRRQLQVLNETDPSCFSAGKHVLYVEAVSQVVDALGTGTFGVYVDEGNHEHSISDNALRVIVRAIAMRSSSRP